MDVIRTNFDDIFQEFSVHLQNSTFVSIDTEFTGLIGSLNALFTPGQFYERIRIGSQKFITLQCGIALFKQDIKSNRFTCRAYNFYTFPKPETSDCLNIIFQCQASSMDFLISHGFDFNKLFKHGINYLNVDQEDQLKKKLAEKKSYREASKQAYKDAPKIKIPPQHEKDVENACKTLASILSDDCSTEEVRVEGMNGFLRKLIYQEIREIYPDKELNIETKEGVLVASKKRKPENPDMEDADLVDRSVGFSKVIRLLAKSGKLIIGHNMTTDLCNLVQHFMTNLPEEYGEFKQTVTSLFPKLIDTKYLATSEELKDFIKSSILGHLYKRISEAPFVQPEVVCDEGYGYTDEASKFHEAAYDAYITGVVFISLFNYLANPDEPSTCVPIEEAIKSSHLKKYLNRLFLMSFDSHMYFGGIDPEPNRDHIFHITFPKSWTQRDIVQLFSPYGPVQIWWLTDTTAWVGLVNKEEGSRVRAALCNNRVSSGVIVEPYVSRKLPVTSPRPANAQRKRSSESSVCSSKKRKSLNMSRNSIETIPEECEELEGGGSFLEGKIFLFFLEWKYTIMMIFILFVAWSGSIMK